MANDANERSHAPGGAAKRPEVGEDRSEKQATGAGREAVNDAPRDHPREHQSNYGGGGPNGGASSDGKERKESAHGGANDGQ